MNEISWFFIGHMVCVSQWAAFLLVNRAYLGKGRVKHVGFWSVVLVAGMLAFSLIFQIGFFTLETVWWNVGYVLLSTLLFGGTLPQKLTAALINGTMCLLSENTVRYVGLLGDRNVASGGLAAARMSGDHDAHEPHRGRGGGLFLAPVEG